MSRMMMGRLRKVSALLSRYGQELRSSEAGDGQYMIIDGASGLVLSGGLTLEQIESELERVSY